MQAFRFTGWAALRRREELCLTTENVASKLGISTSHLDNLEKGRREPSVTVYKDLCRVLGVELDALRTPVDDPTEPREPEGNAA